MNNRYILAVLVCYCIIGTSYCVYYENQAELRPLLEDIQTFNQQRQPIFDYYFRIPENRLSKYFNSMPKRPTWTTSSTSSKTTINSTQPTTLTTQTTSSRNYTTTVYGTKSERINAIISEINQTIRLDLSMNYTYKDKANCSNCSQITNAEECKDFGDYDLNELSLYKRDRNVESGEEVGGMMEAVLGYSRKEKSYKLVYILVGVVSLLVISISILSVYCIRRLCLKRKSKDQTKSIDKTEPTSQSGLDETVDVKKMPTRIENIEDERLSMVSDLPTNNTSLVDLNSTNKVQQMRKDSLSDNSNEARRVNDDYSSFRKYINVDDLGNKKLVPIQLDNLAFNNLSDEMIIYDEFVNNKISPVKSEPLTTPDSTTSKPDCTKNNYHQNCSKTAKPSAKSSRIFSTSLVKKTSTSSKKT